MDDCKVKGSGMREVGGDLLPDGRD